MKIVISTDLYYPMINGVAVFSRNLAAGLAKRGHDVLVLTPSISGVLTEERTDGFRVVRLSSVKFPFYPDQISKVPQAVEIFGKKLPQLAYRNGLHVSFFPYEEIKKVLDEFRPDIIHGQTPGPVALAVYRYAKKRDIPLVATGHAYPDNFTGQIKFLGPAKKGVDAVVRRYFASFLSRAEHATMPTELAIADLIPQKRKQFKVSVEALSNGIDLSRFYPGETPREVYAKYDILVNRPIVLYVGRVDPEKSLDVLVGAIALVAKKNPEAYLVVVGDGSDKDRLQDMAVGLGLADRAKFTGKILGEDLAKLYRGARMFVITSETETQSIVLMEALASGLPAVAVDAGAISELVKSGVNGYLCRPGDEKGVARAIEKILSDPIEAKEMGKKSLEIVKKHDINFTLSRMIGIYEEVVSKHAERMAEESPKKFWRKRG